MTEEVKVNDSNEAYAEIFERIPHTNMDSLMGWNKLPKQEKMFAKYKFVRANLKKYCGIDVPFLKKNTTHKQLTGAYGTIIKDFHDEVTMSTSMWLDDFDKKMKAKEEELIKRFNDKKAKEKAKLEEKKAKKREELKKANPDAVIKG